MNTRAWWTVVVLVGVLIYALRAIETEHSNPSKAEPPKTAEVAEALHNEGPLSKKQVSESGCQQTGADHWRCVVKFQDGGRAIVGAVWNGQGIAYSLISEHGPGR